MARDGAIEAAFRRDRAIAAGGLAAVVLLAWLYLWRSAAAMDHAAMGMGAAAHGAHAAAPVLVFVMWAVMMTGMMLPSAAPTLLVYSDLVRRNGARGRVLPGAWIFAGGYLVAWTAFSAAATVLQVLLERAALLTPAMAFTDATASALMLIGAGLYQATPLKRACLRKCRDPVQFFVTRWRGGAGGTFRMGLEHGAYCLGCCWALMLVLFVAGVMNLLWVALIAAVVLIEKALTAGRAVSMVLAAGLILAGLYLLGTDHLPSAHLPQVPFVFAVAARSPQPGPI